MIESEGGLLPSCIWTVEKNLDHEVLVLLVIEVTDRQLENKRFR